MTDLQQQNSYNSKPHLIQISRTNRILLVGLWVIFTGIWTQQPFCILPPWHSWDAFQEAAITIVVLGFFWVGMSACLIHLISYKVELGNDYIVLHSRFGKSKKLFASEIKHSFYSHGRGFSWLVLATDKRRKLLMLPVTGFSEADTNKIDAFIKTKCSLEGEYYPAIEEKTGIALTAGYLAVLYLIFFATLGYAIYKYYLPAATP